MSKVLLAIEEYSESNEIQSVLKRAGFNVLSISNEYSLSEQIVSFNPDIVVGSGKGSKISTVGIGKRLKEMPRWLGRAILIFPQGQAASPQDITKLRMDMALESPVETTRLIQVIAQLLGLDDRVLIEKALKAQTTESQNKENPVFVGGGNQFEPSWNVKGGSTEIDQFSRIFGGTPPSDSKQNIESLAAKELEKVHLTEKERTSKYESFLRGLALRPESTMDKAQARKVQKALAEHWDKSVIKNQDALRQEFAKELFKKKN